MKTIYTYIETERGERVIYDYDLGGASTPAGIKPGDKALYSEVMLYEDDEVICLVVMIKDPKTGHIYRRQANGTYLHINKGVKNNIKPKNCGVLATHSIDSSRTKTDRLTKAYADEIVWVEAEWFEYIGIDSKEKYKTIHVDRDLDWYLDVVVNAYSGTHASYRTIGDSLQYGIHGNEYLTSAVVEITKYMARTNSYDDVHRNALAFAKIDAFLIGTKKPMIAV